MSVTLAPSHTIQSSIVQTTKTQRSDLAKLQHTQASGERFASTAEMTDLQRQQFMEIQNNTGRVVQIQDNAKSFLQKIDSAMRVVDRIQTKLSSLSGTLIRTSNLSTDDKSILRTEINDILYNMQVEMNATGPGGYIFASGADRNALPVGDIVNTKNYGADNVPNTNYVNNPSSPNQITVSEGMNLSVDLDPAHPAFRDSIAAMHMMLDALDNNLTAIPTDVISLFQTSQSEMSGFLAGTLKTLYENTENAIEKNDELIDNIETQIEETFKVDPLEISTLITKTESQLALSMSILNIILNSPKAWDIVTTSR